MKIIASNKEKKHIKNNIKLKKYWDFDSLDFNFKENFVSCNNYDNSNNEYTSDFINDVMNNLGFILIEEVNGFDLYNFKITNRLKYIHKESGVYLLFESSKVKNDKFVFNNCHLSFQVNNKSNHLMYLFSNYLKGFSSSCYLNSKFNSIRMFDASISLNSLIYNLNNIQENVNLLPFNDQEIISPDFSYVIDLKNYNLNKDDLFNKNIGEKEINEIKNCYIKNISKYIDSFKDDEISNFLLKTEVLNYKMFFEEDDFKEKIKSVISGFFKDKNYLVDRYNRIYFDFNEQELKDNFDFLIYEDFIFNTVRKFNFDQIIFENSEIDINKIKFWFKKLNIEKGFYLKNEFNDLLDKFILLDKNDEIFNDKLENGCSFVDLLINLDIFLFKSNYIDDEFPKSSFILEYIKKVDQQKLEELCTTPNCLGDTLPLELVSGFFSNNIDSLIKLKFVEIIELINSKVPIDKWNMGELENGEVKVNSVLGVFKNEISQKSNEISNYLFQEKIHFLNYIIDLFEKYNITINDVAYNKKNISCDEEIIIEHNQLCKLEDFPKLLEKENENIVKSIYMLSLKLDNDVKDKLKSKCTFRKRKM